MKKLLSTLVIIYMIFGVSFEVNARTEKMTSIEFEAPETLKAGEKAIVSVNIKNANRLYGIQLDYMFNTEELKVNKLEKGEMLANAPYGSMDSSGNPIVEGKPVIYYLTFTGQNDGVSGDGEVIKLELEALKDCKLSFNTSNSTIILVDISKEYEIGNPSFRFIGTDGEEIISSNNPSKVEENNTNYPLILISVLVLVGVGGFIYYKKKQNK